MAGIEDGRRDMAETVGAPRLGMVLTAILMVVYFGFIILGAFAPSVLAKPVLQGGTVTIAFVYGLSVIALGVVLTGIYVAISNGREDR